MYWFVTSDNHVHNKRFLINKKLEKIFCNIKNKVYLIIFWDNLNINWSKPNIRQRTWGKKTMNMTVISKKWTWGTKIMNMKINLKKWIWDRKMKENGNKKSKEHETHEIMNIRRKIKMDTKGKWTGDAKTKNMTYKEDEHDKQKENDTE